MNPEGRYRRSPAGAVILTLVLVGLAAWGVAGSPLFAIRQIRIAGAVRLSVEEVRELSGVSMGENLVRLSPGRVAEDLERSPWIAQAQVTRSLPNTIVLEVKERRGAGWIRAAGRHFLVAADGTLLERLGLRRPPLPFLGSWEGRVGLGRLLEGPPPAIRVAASLPPRLQRAVSRIELADGEVSMHLRSGEAVRYGPPDRLPARADALLAMLLWAERERIEVESYDVRIPESPALRPVGEKQTLPPDSVTAPGGDPAPD